MTCKKSHLSARRESCERKAGEAGESNVRTPGTCAGTMLQILIESSPVCAFTCTGTHVCRWYREMVEKVGMISTMSRFRMVNANIGRRG